MQNRDKNLTEFPSFVTKTMRTTYEFADKLLMCDVVTVLAAQTPPNCYYFDGNLQKILLPKKRIYIPRTVAGNNIYISF